MRSLMNVLLACALVLLMATGVIAQEEIRLVPFSDELMGVEGLIPAGWYPLGNGLYSRIADPVDPTLIALQSAPARLEQVIASLVPQLGLTELPEPIDQIETPFSTWDIYQVGVPSGVYLIMVDLALTHQDGRSYIVLLQAEEGEYQALHNLVFAPVLRALAPYSPEETAEPVPYLAEDVTFPGGAEDVMLAGTLTLPEGDGPFPAVVLASGSGAQDRDESMAPVASIKPFALIADALTRAGVAVLRYDDRGVGESTGDFASAAIPDFISDSAAAIDYLLTRDDIDPEQIGLLGHSEGGLTAAALGASNHNLAFVIGMAPPAVNGLDIVVEQSIAIVASQFPEGRITDEELDAYRDFQTRTLRAVAANDLETAEQVIRETYAWIFENLTPEELAALDIGTSEAFVQSVIDQQLPILGSEWYQSFLNSDAGADWARVTIPTLGLFGAKDIQVLVDQNAPAMEAALEQAGNEDFEIVIFPNANHLFQEAETGALEEYGTLEQTFTPDFLPTLVEWVTARVRVVE